MNKTMLYKIGVVLVLLSMVLTACAAQQLLPRRNLKHQ
jgi:predicted small secreted protein